MRRVFVLVFALLLVSAFAAASIVGAVALVLPVSAQSGNGLALVDGSGAVVQFLCWETTFTATAGPANTMTCTDIGVEEGKISGLPSTSSSR